VKIRGKNDVEFDQISLGEVMLRLDPGDMRIRTARNFSVWEGGGEYNVARGLAKCFGLKTSVITGLADNEVGKLINDLILMGGVGTSHIKWIKGDSIGRTVRNALNFTERGFGVRGALGVSDRGNTASSQLKSSDFDWDHIFGAQGARWLHTGGIFAGLSATTPDVMEAAMLSARKHGTIISYDLNFRPSLWDGLGGKATAQKVNKKLASLVDVMIGNEEDFTESLGFEVKGLDRNYSNLPTAPFKEMVEKVAAAYPNLQIIATTLRKVNSASDNDWGAIAWSRADGFFEVPSFTHLEIFDRVGGGDSFASGLIYGLLEGHDLQKSLQLGQAHGALAMTTPGDTSMASKSEVEKLAAGGSARVVR
jgi:2-dehydro-3-deoxygluconokinase